MYSPTSTPQLGPIIWSPGTTALVLPPAWGSPPPGCVPLSPLNPCIHLSPAQCPPSPQTWPPSPTTSPAIPQAWSDHYSATIQASAPVLNPALRGDINLFVDFSAPSFEPVYLDNGRFAPISSAALFLPATSPPLQKIQIDCGAGIGTICISAEGPHGLTIGCVLRRLYDALQGQYCAYGKKGFEILAPCTKFGQLYWKGLSGSGSHAVHSFHLSATSKSTLLLKYR